MTNRLGDLFPVPMAGVAVLLVVLIFLTPNLLSAAGGPAAGSLATQAELFIDRTTTGSTTDLYVHGFGDVRYASITLQIATNVTWPPPAHLPASSWNTTLTLNETLAAITSTSANPFAVNVTAVYIDSTMTTVWYLGTYVIDVSGGVLSIDALLPGAGSISPTPIDDLPLALLLSGYGSGVAT
ncbi:MAG: hypothetical protein L3K17_06260 [Thermoplasmata archaeon]|nr:hypothetical protein [Thermoplasmata archaeon]